MLVKFNDRAYFASQETSANREIDFVPRLRFQIMSSFPSFFNQGACAIHTYHAAAILNLKQG